MEHLSRLVGRFYSTGSDGSRTELENEVQKLRRSPEAVIPMILAQVMCPAFKLIDNALEYHPQLVFVCLGLVQDAIHNWIHLPPTLQTGISQVLSKCFQSHEMLKLPTLVSSKLIQLVANLTLHAWPSEYDPFPQLVADIEQYLLHGTAPLISGTDLNSRFMFNLSLVLTTARELCDAPECKYIMSERKTKISEHWSMYARDLEAFAVRVLAVLGSFKPDGFTGQGQDATPDASALYPSPVSPKPPNSKLSSLPTSLIQSIAHILSVLQTLPHALDTHTLAVVRSYVQYPSTRVSLAAIEVLHINLELPCDPAKFFSLMDITTDVIKDSVTIALVYCKELSHNDDGLDDTLDDLDSVETGSAPTFEEKRSFVVLRKTVQDLASTMSTVHLTRMSAPQLLTFANVLVPAMVFPGIIGSEARKAILDIIQVLGPLKMPRDQYIGMVRFVTEHVANQLNFIQVSDLDSEDKLITAQLKDHGAIHHDHTVALNNTRLRQVINLLEAIADVNLLETLNLVFPTLNSAVASLETCYDPASPIPMALLVTYAVSLRIITQLLPKCESITETASVPDIVTCKCISLVSPLSKRVMKCHLIPGGAGSGTYRALKETLFVIQSCLPYVKNVDDKLKLDATVALVHTFELFTAPLLKNQRLGHEYFTLCIISSRLIASMCGMLPFEDCQNLVDPLGSSIVLLTKALVPLDPLNPLSDSMIRALVTCCIQNHHPRNNVQKLSVSHISLSNSSRLYSIIVQLLNSISPNPETTNINPHILCSLIRAVQNDSPLIKADILSVIYQLNWLPMLMNELIHFIKHPELGSCVRRVHELTHVFTEYTDTFMKSEFATGLANAFVEHPKVLLGSYPAVGPPLYDFLLHLVLIGRAFEPEIPNFGDMLIQYQDQIKITPSFLDILSGILSNHWQVFFPTCTSAESPNHRSALMAILTVFLKTFETNDIELVRCAIVEMTTINQTRKLYTKSIWNSEFRPKTIQILVKCLFRAELSLLQDGLVITLEEIFKSSHEMPNVLHDSQTHVYQTLASLAPPRNEYSGNTELLSAWGAQLQHKVECLADKSRFESVLKSLVHDLHVFRQV